MATITLDPQVYCSSCTHPWTRHADVGGMWRCTQVTKHGYRNQREFCPCSALPPLPEEVSS